MVRRLVLSAAVLGLSLAMAQGAAAETTPSCDVNAEQAAVVAAWGSKLRDGSISAADSEAISSRIQELPRLAQDDPESACQALQDLKIQLGLVSAQ